MLAYVERLHRRNLDVVVATDFFSTEMWTPAMSSRLWRVKDGRASVTRSVRVDQSRPPVRPEAGSFKSVLLITQDGFDAAMTASYSARQLVVKHGITR